MTIFFTSDPHVDCETAARKRGWRSPAEYDAWYYRMWRSTVTKSDTVYVLGDLVEKPPARISRGLTMFASLPGRKHLVSGNHDAVHPMYPESRDPDVYRRWLQVFDSILPFGRVTIAGHPVMLSHFPYEGHPDYHVGRDEWRLRDEGYWLLHGDTHGPERHHGGRQIHVGIDAWGGLVPEHTIADIIRDCA